MPNAIDPLATRRSVPPLLLNDPAPEGAVLDQLLTVATRVPDHGKLTPWRIRIIRGAARERFGDLLAQVFGEANPQASAEQIAFERARPMRSPLILCVVSCAREHVKIPRWEQTLSAAAVCMNTLHAAQALGFGGSWLTEWYAYDAKVRAALDVAEDEKIAGFIYIGTPKSVPEDRQRPVLADVVSEWTGQGTRAES
ncbi:MAG TPA: nitroreductase [Hyphomicrobiales bacterium]|nr:nitroreductase [Rhodobiaceae bacterium]HXK53889.1 nitroreductase [Hyphomicrobiales bacterium]